jgi:protein-S-isoprenylcysteine O-methyltransferase Ste14
MEDWLLGALWIAYMASQGLGARHAAPTIRRAEDPLYPVYLLATIGGLLLILTTVGDISILGRHLVPTHPAWFWSGFAVTAIGLGLAWWARRRLGRFWASAIELKTGHKLVQDGPYRLVRHPVYAGLILAALGSGIGDGDVGSAIGFAIIAASFIIKSRREERFIATNFGDEFRAWRERTWALVPFVY